VKKRRVIGSVLSEDVFPERPPLELHESGYVELAVGIISATADLVTPDSIMILPTNYYLFFSRRLF
jgi:hypothetical protein